MFRALYGFNHAIGCCGTDSQAQSHVLAGLVVETIDWYLRLAQQTRQQAVWLQADGVRGVATVLLLAVLDASAIHLRVNVLVESAP